MYHYKSCGLKKIYLKNGYRVRDTKYGQSVFIHNIEGLHRALALDLIENRPFLTGPQFRFLRKELGMSHERIAIILGNDAQSISLWERQGRLPKWADLFMRKLYMEYIGNNKTIVEFVDELNQLDREGHLGKMMYEEKDHHWSSEAA